MPQPLRQSALALDRAIAWADLTSACLRGSLPVLGALEATAREAAGRRLAEAERRAEAPRGRRDLLALAGARGGRTT